MKQVFLAYEKIQFSFSLFCTEFNFVGLACYDVRKEGDSSGIVNKSENLKFSDRGIVVVKMNSRRKSCTNGRFCAWFFGFCELRMEAGNEKRAEKWQKRCVFWQMEGVFFVPEKNYLTVEFFYRREIIFQNKAWFS
jgi:hypothetical protein